MGEQALHALILSSKDKKDLETLYDAGGRLISQYPNSTHAKDTLGVLIDTSVSTGQLRLLAADLETFCKKYPNNENAADFLLQAAKIREGLGQYTQANNNYRQYLSHHANSTGNTDEIVFSMVNNLQRLEKPMGVIRLLTTYQEKLSKQGKQRAITQLAILYITTDRRSKAKKYGQMAKKAYRPEMGELDPSLRDLMAQLTYLQIQGGSGKYYQLHLKKKIDNTIVQKKTSLLNRLEEGYQQVLAYQSPAWALKACFRANELNAEFADFLVSAPVPEELTAEQRTQYLQLIQQKAQAYTDKAEQYLQTCITLAEKWEICDPELSGYFYPRNNPQGKKGVLKSISHRTSSTEITLQGMKQPPLSDIYIQLLDAPEDCPLQLQLARAYLKMGDYTQAGLVAKNALPKIRSDQRRLKADFYNLVGLTHLYGGRDPLAKESFKMALKSDNRLAAARLNLAGVLRHYGHEDKASALLQEGIWSNPDPDSIHPGFRADALPGMRTDKKLNASIKEMKQ
jgi:hypothetical protein